METIVGFWKHRLGPFASQFRNLYQLTQISPIACFQRVYGSCRLLQADFAIVGIGMPLNSFAIQVAIDSA
ncbi:MAG TPA: hypothetical protein PLY87_07630 [Planctomycetaceae bacterium]|nr:hypothetical protein [Planctomycetaceae bacterium]HQZ64929.1 hypothetical protein [Planctomycetaceae bacterium]